MAKYFITFVLLAFLALENNSIYSRRIHTTWTDASDEADLTHHARYQQYQLLQRHTQPHQQQQAAAKQRHKRAHRHEHREQFSSGGSAEDDEAAAALLEHYDLLQRHLAHKREQLLQQRKQAHSNSESSRNRQQQQHNFGTMPRIWQHLRSPEDRMYGDAPYSEELSNEAAADFPSSPEIPPNSNERRAEVERIISSAEWNERETNEISSSGSSIEDESRESAETSVDVESHKSKSSTSSVPTPRCPKCENSQRKVQHISEEQLTNLRIEFVKQQILEKLRLKERPKVSTVVLPKPISEGTTIEHVDEQSKNKDLDDYYARTSKKFIFLEREMRECQRLGPHPSICFSFKIDDADADGFDISTAVLWIFKSKRNDTKQRTTNAMLEQQTIVVSEVQQQLDSNYLPKVKPIAIQTVDVQDEWMKIDIEWPIKRWFGNHDLSHLIHISCQSCDISSMDEMISVDKDYRPFIMVDTQNRRRTSRKKRSVNCTDGVTECCREKLYISFDEIGWGDWIIQPRGYDAYFCRGSCSSVASVTQISTLHSSFLQKAAIANKAKGKEYLELIPCCTAKQYSSLQLVYMDSNNTATLKTLPNMVIESCGCR